MAGLLQEKPVFDCNGKMKSPELSLSFIENYFVNTDMASTNGWTAVISNQYKDYGNGKIGDYNVYISPATVDETHLASEYCFGFECRWSANYASYTQESMSKLPAGTYTLSFDVENVNPNTTSASYENRFTVTVGNHVYTDQATEWMQGKSGWTKHSILFTVSEAAKVTLSFGYGMGSNNFGASQTPAIYVSHLNLNYLEPLEAANLTDGGSYYIYNVGTKKYLAAGANWGTHAVVNETGLDFGIQLNNNKYLINSLVFNSNTNHYLNGLYVDGSAFEWTIGKPKQENNRFLIFNGDGFLTVNGTGIVDLGQDGNSTNALWEFRTISERIAELTTATIENGIDATFLLPGANFGRNDRRVQSWKVSDNCTNYNLSGGNNENNCAESYRSVFTISQTLTNVPDGIYSVAAQGFYRHDLNSGGNLPYFFANDEKRTFPLQEGSENNMATASVSFSNGLYEIEPIIVVVTDGILNIGIVSETADNWCIWDNFRLTYYGEEENVVIDRLKLRYNELVTKANQLLLDEANQSDYARQLLEASLALPHETRGELEAAIDSITNSLSISMTIFNAMSKYLDQRDRYTAITNQTEVYMGSTAKSTFDSYVSELDALAIQAASATAIDDYRAQLRSAISTFLSNVDIHKGYAFDLTGLIYNPMMQDTEGWEGSKPRILWEGVSYQNGEFYEVDFDLYQELTDMPAGNYTLKVQAFERPGNNATTYSNYVNGIDHSQSCIYINDGQTRIKNVMDESSETQLFMGGTSLADYQRPDGRWVPNGMEGAHIYFDRGYYENEVLVHINEGTLRFGFRCVNHASYSWTLFSNFRLYYSGTAIDVSLSEDADLQLISDIDNANVTLQCTVEADKWQAMALPFSISDDDVKQAFGSDAQVAEFTTDIEGDIIFTPSTTGIEAHHPFLLKTSQSGNSYLFEGKAILKPSNNFSAFGDGTDFRFVCNFESGTVLPTGSYHIVDGCLIPYAYGATLKSYRAYLLSKHGLVVDTLPFVTDGLDPKRIDEEEWTVLKQFYSSTAGEKWTRQWPVSNTTVTTRQLNGITALNGKIVSIILDNNNITGSFPYMLLSLPRLKKLNLAFNHLQGDLGMGVANYTQLYPTLSFSPIDTLWINSNELSGNIGLFASYLPTLVSLDIQANKISDVIPMISPSITDFIIGIQHIEKVYSIDLATSSHTVLPSIILYNHQTQTYETTFKLGVRSEEQIDANWKCDISYNEDGIYGYSLLSINNVYYKNKGDTIYINYNNNASDITFKAELFFPDGDSNFNGIVDVTDLQADVNYIFEEYNSQKPYNFTAANLWADEEINVQDLVKLVDVLMEQEPAASRRNSRQATASQRRASQEYEAASVYLSGGRLVVSTTVPVAAFDVTVSDCTELAVPETLTQMGFLCTVRKTAGGMRIIGFSLTGAVLPVGDNMIGHATGATSSVTHAVLSDSDADVISTATGGEVTSIEAGIRPKTHSGAAYRLPVGAGKAILIDHDGRKTLETSKKTSR